MLHSPGKPKTISLGSLALQMTVLLLSASTLTAQDKPAASWPQPKAHSMTTNFDETADKALQAMEKRAGELHIKGVALVAFAPGESVQSWSSKMRVVGHLKNPPAKDNKGDNLLGIAYSKAAEMADTLKDSGSGIRPPMTGEYGWQGGVVARGKTGILIVAFSGGSSEDDVKASRAGLAVLANAL